ncbi:MAG TPA: hypothetical protein VMV09_01325, partial [Candidatus Saccharimonadales bacterium]|nr:hypothetical protein [Candidatus Saccharimonadales bacterium]
RHLPSCQASSKLLPLLGPDPALSSNRYGARPHEREWIDEFPRWPDRRRHPFAGISPALGILWTSVWEHEAFHKEVFG